MPRHLQIIACAGSGKTETLARRIAELIAEGASPASIVAFTFTERAAGELKERVGRRVEGKAGRAALDRLGPMFVGTIHSYCFRLLQTFVPRYGNYDVLDDHRHAGLLSREYRRLGLERLGSPRHWKPIRDFVHTADIIANELIDPTRLEGTPLGACYAAYCEMLDRYHFLTFGQLIALAVQELQKPEVFDGVHGSLRHLLVDEYQDINPAQERLIELLAREPVGLTVVGDDDQSIYQWRGADVANILGFRGRYADVETESLDTNHRSRPTIVEAANALARRIAPRLEKAMKAGREPGDVEFVAWRAETPEEEAEGVAETIEALHEGGFAYRDVAVLFRSVRTSAPPLVEALQRRRIPFGCGGRTGLFLQPEAALFGEIHAWFVDGDWKDGRFEELRPVDIEAVVAGLERLFADGRALPWLRKYLEDWKRDRLSGRRPVSLVDDFYQALRRLGAHEIDPDTPEGSARLGALARFSHVLADFEHVTRRGRHAERNGRRQFETGADRGKAYAQQLCSYLLHYARDAYEEFAGEEAVDVDAVDILTVHQSKGLEWPIVFLPSLVEGRFPSRRAGQKQEWLLPEEVFPAGVRERYEGSETEERRLFYVALTRARDCLYLSHFERKINAFKPSRFLTEVCGEAAQEETLPKPKPAGERGREPPPLAISFSDAAVYEDCGYRYRLGNVFAFQKELAVELGYGRAIHHVLRQIAERGRALGREPTGDEVRQILAEEFYLPFANAPTFDRMTKAARRLIDRYLSDYRDELTRIWATERAFELHLEDGTLSGRADVILGDPGESPSLTIVDYKTSTDPRREEHDRLQLAVYAAAGRGEGLEVEAAYLHELDEGTRKPVDVSEASARAAADRVGGWIKGIRQGAFVPKPEAETCARCDYRRVCRHAACAPEDL